jgi:hypothetical protein
VIVLAGVLLLRGSCLAMAMGETFGMQKAFDQLAEKAENGDYTRLYQESDGTLVEVYEVVLEPGKVFSSELRTKVTYQGKEVPCDVSDWQTGCREVRAGGTLEWSYQVFGDEILMTMEADITRASGNVLKGGLITSHYEPLSGWIYNASEAYFDVNEQPNISATAWVQYKTGMAAIPITLAGSAVFDLSEDSNEVRYRCHSSLH